MFCSVDAGPSATVPAALRTRGVELVHRGDGGVDVEICTMGLSAFGKNFAPFGVAPWSRASRSPHNTCGTIFRTAPPGVGGSPSLSAQIVCVSTITCWGFGLDGLDYKSAHGEDKHGGVCRVDAMLPESGRKKLACRLRLRESHSQHAGPNAISLGRMRERILRFGRIDFLTEQ